MSYYIIDAAGRFLTDADNFLFNSYVHHAAVKFKNYDAACDIRRKLYTVDSCHKWCSRNHLVRNAEVVEI